MGLSAKRLGREYGLTAEEMNVLLKEEGFLDGSPGNYSLTEKGERYASERYDGNGYGGYAARSWQWLEWDESIMEELHITTERKNEIREKTAAQRRRRSAEKKVASEEYWKEVNSRNQQSASPQYAEQSASYQKTDQSESSPLGTVIIGGFVFVGLGICKIIRHFIKREK